MLVAYFSPVAPAAVLLLGAFILPFVVAWFSKRRHSAASLRYLVAAGVVELAIFALFATRFTVGAEIADQGVEVLTGWRFSPAETVSILAIRADELGLPFLILTLLLLLAATLVAPSLMAGAEDQNHGEVFDWLSLGASASFLFVAANGASLAYAFLAFDIFAALYWFRRNQAGLAVARLGLGIVTAVEVASSTLILASGMLPGGFLLGLLLWLRLGAYPFIEANAYRRQRDNNFLVYLVLSLVVTIYLFVRIPFEPWPNLIQWLIVLTMLLNGLLAWLIGTPAPAAEPAADQEALTGSRSEVTPALTADDRPPLLIPLILAQALLILLAVPVAQGVAVAVAMTLALSMAVLWITPRMGPPSLVEKAWIWPYLPAATASLTLIGLPFTLGWPARTSLYRSLILSAGVEVLLVVSLADALALSALIRYWSFVWQGRQKNGRRSGVAILVMVPFLIPLLGPFILSTLIRRDLAMADFNQSAWVFGAMLGSIIGAIALDSYRQYILARFNISPGTWLEIAYLHWLTTWLARLADRLGKIILRAQVLVEGQHYMGWALFIALVGALIILLS